MTMSVQLPQAPQDLVWIASGGGPLLLVPGEYMAQWEGIETPSGGRQVEATFRWAWADSPATDYDRACDVQGYLGLVEIGAGQGLVLSGEPTLTTWAPCTFVDTPGNSSAGGMLVRWIFADSEEHVLNALRSIPEDVWIDDGPILQIGEQPLYMFDSSSPAIDLTGDDYLTIRLPPGDYRLATVVFQPDKHTQLVLHRLKLCT